MILKILCVHIQIYHTAWAISVIMELDSNEVVYINLVFIISTLE